MPGRSKPLDHDTKGLRRTGISRTSSLGRGKGMPRSALPCPSPAPKAKRKAPTVSPEEKRARQLVRARSGRVCEGCSQARATNWAHRVGRGQLGPWCPTNGLDLCGSGTTGCHGWATANPKAARAKGWVLRSTDQPGELPALHALHGWILLDEDGGWVQVDAEGALAALAA
jgi:hypothetical protein